MEKRFRKFYEHFSFIREKKEKKFKIAINWGFSMWVFC